MQIMGPLLTGNARSFILAAISPDPKDYLETVSTLRLAARAQKIQVITAQGLIQPLKKETRKPAKPVADSLHPPLPAGHQLQSTHLARHKCCCILHT